MEVKPGDWVRFYRNGEMVIGVVQYVRKQLHYPWEPEALTDQGPVAAAAILESRSQAQEG